MDPSTATSSNSSSPLFDTCMDVTSIVGINGVGGVETVVSSSYSFSEQDDMLLNCYLIQLSKQYIEDKSRIDNFVQTNSRDRFLFLASSLVFLMQAGFAMICAGAVKRKNLQNTMLKNLMDACGSSVAFYSVGYAFAFGDSKDNPNHFIGTTNFFLHDVDDYAFWMFQFTFSAAAATIVAGALAERCTMKAYFYYSIWLTGFVYPIIVHSIWSTKGFLSTSLINPIFGVGVIDYAGSGVVHLTGGMTALIALHILGPRRGRFHDFETGEILDIPNPMPGHSISLGVLGTFILWFGWYGFNPGSTLLLDTTEPDTLAALAAINTTLSAGIGGLTAVSINLWLVEWVTGDIVYDVVYCMNGILSGLVAITAGCGIVEAWSAVIIGFVAGLIYLISSWTLIFYRYDDAVDAVPVHMINGIWGMIATGLFASPQRLEVGFGITDYAGLVYSGYGWNLFGAQIVAVLWIIGWVMLTMVPFFYFLDKRGVLRIDALSEYRGLDADFADGFVGDVGTLKLTKDEIKEIQFRLEERLDDIDAAAEEYEYEDGGDGGNGMFKNNFDFNIAKGGSQDGLPMEVSIRTSGEENF